MIILPHAHKQAVKGAPVGSRFRSLDPNLCCVKRIPNQHSSYPWSKMNHERNILADMKKMKHLLVQIAGFSHLPYNLQRIQETCLSIIFRLFLIFHQF